MSSKKKSQSNDKSSIRESICKLQSMLLENEIELRRLLAIEDPNPNQKAELSSLKRSVESIRRVIDIFERKEKS
jgi:hypothetical protein